MLNFALQGTMLSTKNLSPRQLSAFTAGILSVPIAIIIYIITGNWRMGVGSLVFIFAGGYGLILLTLEKFIYRKIKLIYKFIYQTKATKKEFELLYLLASRPGRVFLRNEILNHVWGNDVIVGDRTIDVHIRKVRQKLGIDCITTVKGVGYKFDL